MSTVENFLNDAETRMGKTLDSLKTDLGKIRTGRASISLLDHIMVDYYGSPTSISQVANISLSDARTLTVTPYEKNMVQPIEKAIMESDLGINPTTAGTVIRLPMPPLTEERRKELVKLAKVEGENGKVATRNIRRDANQHIKDLLKKKEISEDDDKRGEDSIQKLTDKFVASIDKLISEKEKDIMEI
jgi:ribosome recycling factor